MFEKCVVDIVEPIFDSFNFKKKQVIASSIRILEEGSIFGNVGDTDQNPLDHRNEGVFAVIRHDFESRGGFSVQTMRVDGELIE